MILMVVVEKHNTKNRSKNQNNINSIEASKNQTIQSPMMLMRFSAKQLNIMNN